MKGALMKRSDSNCCFLTGHLLEGFADGPIQSPFQLVAALEPSQSQQPLPLKFFSQLVLDLRPKCFQADGAVRDATIAGPFPQFAIGDVEIVIQQVGL